jgi:hypothetical protein
VLAHGADPDTGEKVQNLQAAVRAARKRSQIFAFADSDGRLTRGWLRALAAPLGNYRDDSTADSVRIEADLVARRFGPQSGPMACGPRAAPSAQRCDLTDVASAPFVPTPAAQGSGVRQSYPPTFPRQKKHLISPIRQWYNM